uniref:Uncharacterized protein n=1 Tax=Sphaerodactylus townsendi TaxID=933632 RepID=A0ACB8G5R6_9SAUR
MVFCSAWPVFLTILNYQRWVLDIVAIFSEHRRSSLEGHGGSSDVTVALPGGSVSKLKGWRTAFLFSKVMLTSTMMVLFFSFVAEYHVRLQLAPSSGHHSIQDDDALGVEMNDVQTEMIDQAPVSKACEVSTRQGVAAGIPLKGKSGMPCPRLVSVGALWCTFL